MADAISLNRLPVQEPAVFSGDSLAYPIWKSAFSLLIGRQPIPATEKLLYLQKYVGGLARESVKGFFLLRNEAAYHGALEVLEQRFGNPFIVAQAFRDKLDSWGVVKNKDCTALRSLADFLRQCVIAAQVVGGMGILDDSQYQKRLIEKLPDWMANRWLRKVNEVKDTKGRYPTFAELADFIAKEADVASDPVFGNLAKPASSAHSSGTSSSTGMQRNAMRTETTPYQSCLYCEAQGHQLPECRKLAAKPLQERREFVMKNKLCFACAISTDHRSRECKDRGTCATCKKRHPTFLHDDNFSWQPSQAVMS